MPIPSHSIPLHLLSLPAEIRFMIYREVWAVTVKPGSEDGENVEDIDSHNELDSNSDSDQDSESVDEEDLNQINQQFESVASLQNLANTCAQIRDELITELAHTQIHLRNSHPRLHAYFAYRASHYGFLERLRSSPLFTKHVQHVSLHWDKCIITLGSQYHYLQDCNEVPDWLGKCEQLKTLELVITDPLYSATEDFTKEWVPGMVAPTEDERNLPLSHDDNPNIAGRRYSIVVRGDGKWAETGWFQREMHTAGVEEEDLEGNKIDAVVKKQAPEYKFKHHFGTVGVVWPLLDRI
ncbi:hypothetical protein QBC32DRAFT_373805 [Pseudoneurospora amorphoporcata]|uniref:Uncharacterized protein n=1 Tax=Pseudoneurospora amorphoporcata TaxID=241081 RepID=A0AAN6NLK0_9PEZI|nr:hypothetical protein QBC32DRAFT_373805 [Pseudoneurospora amorphoporcata]